MDLRGGIGVRAVTSWLPEARSTAKEAERDGLLDSATLAKLGIRELPVADLAAPEMAVLAARAALARADVPAAELDLLVHAWIHHQGHDFWSPPHYLARELGAPQALPLGIQQMCNGGAAALQTAAAHLLADTAIRYALVTTADRFASPGFDRWRGDYGVVYGDGATALLLDRQVRDDDVLHLLALATTAEPDLETVHRGDDPFSPAPLWFGPTIDVRHTKKAFLTANGPERLLEVTREAVHKVVHRVLEQAGVAQDDPRIRQVLLPRLGRDALDNGYRAGLPHLPAAQIPDLGAGTGHLGAGDILANLADLVTDGLLAPGEMAVAISGGGGFTWSAVLVQAPKATRTSREGTQTKPKEQK